MLGGYYVGRIIRWRGRLRVERKGFPSQASAWTYARDQRVGLGRHVWIEADGHAAVLPPAERPLSWGAPATARKIMAGLARRGTLRQTA